jgi:hypothetical protein
MTREKLATLSRDDDSFDSFFPESIDELQNELSGREYVAFLEQLRDDYSEIFAMSLDWNTRSMVFQYIAEGRMADIDRAADYLANRMEEISAPLFSLISVIRLAGQAEAAQRLIDAAEPLIAKSDLMGWAVDDLIEWSMFGLVQACLESGATDEGMEVVYQKSLGLGMDDTKSNRTCQRERISRLAGICKKPWTREELLALDNKELREQLYLLLFDYVRWLTQIRGFQPVVADELRCILAHRIVRMKGSPSDLFRGLRTKNFEPALAEKLQFLSLEPFHAPAAVVAMRLFYDFLLAHDLVDKRTCDTAHDVCYVLWRTLKKVMTKDWGQYRFLEAYLPSPTTATTGQEN